MRRIEIHLKDFVFIKNPKKGIQRRFESQKRKEKKWEEFKSTWRILYYIQNPKREFKEGLSARKKKKRNEKYLNPPEGFCITFRIPKGNSKKVWKTKKKRNEKNWNPPEGFCITFRIPKGNSKKVWKPKKKRKEMRRIEIHLKDFVLHSESQKGIQRRFERQKRKEKKWEQFKSTWRILYYIQNPKRQLTEGLKAKKKWKEMRRIEIHLKDFVLHSESQKGIQRRFESQKKKEKKWEEL